MSSFSTAIMKLSLINPVTGLNCDIFSWKIKIKQNNLEDDFNIILELVTRNK